jgi:3-deoxy-D-manno-octulosonate 8-phosphate phosphatase (KDO 8-P phosphatase)
MQARSTNKYRVAKALGFSPNRIGEWDAGNGPTLEELIVVADHFQVSVDRLLRGEIRRPAPEQIKMLVLDVDGVLSDGGMYVSEKGDELKKFHTRDGRGIIEIQKKGIEVAILSGGLRGDAVYARAERLGIARVYVGTTPKPQIMDKWLRETGLSYENIAYVGDDLNDLGIIERVAFSACPSDAAWQVKEVVDVILTREGGRGCVREFIELYLGL